MELDWSTYLLEVLNFLVLVWLLKRFLYQPVLDIISRRRQAIEATAARAEAQRREAEELRGQYEGRLAAWEREKQEGRATLQQELDGIRQRRLAEVEEAVAGARERNRVRDERQLRAALAAREREALELAGRFAARLLGRAAGPDLEARLVEAALADLAAAPAATRRALAEALGEGAMPTVQSAYELGDERRTAIATALARLAGRPVQPVFGREPALLAGLRIVAGPWVLRANLGDELEGFISVGRDGREP